MDACELIRFLSLKTWRIQRTISDRRLGLPLSFSGNSSFTPQGSSWLYEERGELVSDNRTYAASRRYLYKSESSFIAVCFEDGRPFYSIDCNRLPEASFEHFCGMDQYIGTLWVGSYSWKIDWKIIGPNKDLEISSSFL